MAADRDAQRLFARGQKIVAAQGIDAHAFGERGRPDVEAVDRRRREVAGGIGLSEFEGDRAVAQLRQHRGRQQQRPVAVFVGGGRQAQGRLPVGQQDGDLRARLGVAVQRDAEGQFAGVDHAVLGHRGEGGGLRLAVDLQRVLDARRGVSGAVRLFELDVYDPVAQLGDLVGEQCVLPKPLRIDRDAARADMAAGPGVAQHHLCARVAAAAENDRAGRFLGIDAVVVGDGEEGGGRRKGVEDDAGQAGPLGVGQGGVAGTVGLDEQDFDVAIADGAPLHDAERGFPVAVGVGDDVFDERAVDAGRDVAQLQGDARVRIGASRQKDAGIALGRADAAVAADHRLVEAGRGRGIDVDDQTVCVSGRRGQPIDERRTDDAERVTARVEAELSDVVAEFVADDFGQDFARLEAAVEIGVVEQDDPLAGGGAPADAQQALVVAAALGAKTAVVDVAVEFVAAVMRRIERQTRRPAGEPCVDGVEHGERLSGIAGAVVMGRRDGDEFLMRPVFGDEVACDGDQGIAPRQIVGGEGVGDAPGSPGQPQRLARARVLAEGDGELKVLRDRLAVPIDEDLLPFQRTGPAAVAPGAIGVRVVGGGEGEAACTGRDGQGVDQEIETLPGGAVSGGIGLPDFDADRAFPEAGDFRRAERDTPALGVRRDVAGLAQDRLGADVKDELQFGAGFAFAAERSAARRRFGGVEHVVLRGRQLLGRRRATIDADQLREARRTGLSVTVFDKGAQQMGAFAEVDVEREAAVGPRPAAAQVLAGVHDPVAVLVEEEMHVEVWLRRAAHGQALRLGGDVIVVEASAVVAAVERQPLGRVQGAGADRESARAAAGDAGVSRLVRLRRTDADLAVAEQLQRGLRQPGAPAAVGADQQVGERTVLDRSGLEDQADACARLAPAADFHARRFDFAGGDDVVAGDGVDAGGADLAVEGDGQRVYQALRGALAAAGRVVRDADDMMQALLGQGDRRAETAVRRDRDFAEPGVVGVDGAVAVAVDIEPGQHSGRAAPLDVQRREAGEAVVCAAARVLSVLEAQRADFGQRFGAEVDRARGRGRNVPGDIGLGHLDADFAVETAAEGKAQRAAGGRVRADVGGDVDAPDAVALNMGFEHDLGRSLRQAQRDFGARFAGAREGHAGGLQLVEAEAIVLADRAKAGGDRQRVDFETTRGDLRRAVADLVLAGEKIGVAAVVQGAGGEDEATAARVGGQRGEVFALLGQPVEVGVAIDANRAPFGSEAFEGGRRVRGDVVAPGAVGVGGQPQFARRCRRILAQGDFLRRGPGRIARRVEAAGLDFQPAVGHAGEGRGEKHGPLPVRVGLRVDPGGPAVDVRQLDADPGSGFGFALQDGRGEGDFGGRQQAIGEGSGERNPWRGGGRRVDLQGEFADMAERLPLRRYHGGADAERAFAERADVVGRELELPAPVLDREGAHPRALAAVQADLEGESRGAVADQGKAVLGQVQAVDPAFAACAREGGRVERGQRGGVAPVGRLMRFEVCGRGLERRAGADVDAARQRRAELRVGGKEGGDAVDVGQIGRQVRFDQLSRTARVRGCLRVVICVVRLFRGREIAALERPRLVWRSGGNHRGVARREVALDDDGDGAVIALADQEKQQVVAAALGVTKRAAEVERFVGREADGLAVTQAE